MRAGPADPSCAAGPEGHCITCGDVAEPVTVLSLAQDGLAECALDDGCRAVVDVSLVGPVGPSDRLLVHAGTALARLGEGLG